MSWIRKHRPSPATGIAVAALFVAIGGAAFAAIPDSNGTIHACYHKSNGGLRVVESSDDCRGGSERSLSWNQEGPPGEPGSPGQAVAFDEEAGEVTTSSSAFVDLGGPSVTINVPPNGLVAVFARVDMKGAGEQTVGLHEATTFDPPIALMGTSFAENFIRKWSSSGEGQASGPAQGTGDPLEASWSLLEASPGTHTYSLLYRRGTGSFPDPATFRNRALWVRPGG